MPNDDWRQQARAAARATLLQMRQELHRITAPNASPSMSEMLRMVHHLYGQSRLFNLPPLTLLARATEMLVFMLEENPERIETLALRTIGQAVDFLGLLLDERSAMHIPDVQGAWVVIIEDEPAARELIMTAMELVGLRSNGYERPSEGLAKLGGGPTDLIFLDLNLPEMNGFELCNQIRAMPHHEGTPIVFLTGMSSFQNRVQSSLSGGNDFVAKPFNMAELGVKALIWVMKGRLGMR